MIKTDSRQLAYANHGCENIPGKPKTSLSDGARGKGNLSLTALLPSKLQISV
jgi:hypothetical protein